MILASVVLFTMFLLSALWRANLKSRQLSFPSWQELAGRLQPVNTKGIRTLAMDHMDPAASTKGRGYDEIMEMVGEIEGLKRMKENAEVLIALAAYSQVWSPSESTIVMERMRRDGLALRRAVVGLGIAITLGYGRERILAYIHEAASSYYLMRERLLALYRHSHAGVHPILADLI